MATCQTEVSIEGFDIIRLTNACMSVSIMPQLGGKIYELVDLRTGRDWLWKNPYIPLRHPQPDLDYEKELDSGGWDEILFSVKPCILELADGQNLLFGDHGSVVDRDWQNLEAGVNDKGDATCELVVEGQAPHFRLSRRIVLNAEQARLDIEYKLTNTGTSPWPWLWCAHPLLAIEEGMMINVPNGQQIRTDPFNPLCSHDRGMEQTWPLLASPEGGLINLAAIFDRSTAPETFCAKLFVESSEEVSVSTANGNESLSIMYKPEEIPWLGFWINKNGWSGCGSEPYLNLGLEPATSPHDTLTQAVAYGECTVLEAGMTTQWSLTVYLNHRVNRHD